MSIFKIVLVLIVILIGLAFHLRNEQLVVVDYYLGNNEMPLSLALVVALFIGAVLGALSGLPILIKLKRDKARLGRQLKTHQTGNAPQTLISADKDKSADDAPLLKTCRGMD